MSRAAVVDGAGVAPPPRPFSRAVWAGDLLYVSGQTGTDAASGRLVEGGIGGETRKVLANLSAVLQAAGLGMEDVVKANVYLVDMEEFAAMNGVAPSSICSGRR